MKPLIAAILIILQGGALGCSFYPVNPHGPWIGGFSHLDSNPLITTDQKGALVSLLVVYEDDDSEYEITIIIDASTGSVRKRTLDDSFTLTEAAQAVGDVTAGYRLGVDEATDEETTMGAELRSPDGSLFEFTIQAPEDSGVESHSYNFFVSTELNTAYLVIGKSEFHDFTNYAVLDLTASPNSNNSVPIIQLQEFPRRYAPDHTWPPEQYKDLQLLSLLTGDSCDGRFHLHYNETHLTSAEGMEYYTNTRAIDRGDSVQEHSYYSLTVDTEVIPTEDPDPTDDWTWQAEDNRVIGYTLRERNMITGDILREVLLSMEDIQTIADELASGVTERQFFRSSAKKKNNHQESPDLTTIHVKASLEFEFFQGKGGTPDGEDLGSLIAQTQGFFREAFQSKSHSLVDFTMTNVIPEQENEAPDRFILEFVSNIVQEGDSLNDKKAAEIMAGANFKRYISDYLRSSQSGPFHSTFKVFFKGIAKS